MNVSFTSLFLLCLEQMFVVLLHLDKLMVVNWIVWCFLSCYDHCYCQLSYIWCKHSIFCCCCVLHLYICFNLVCNRTVAVLDAALNPRQLLLWMSHRKDWEYKGEQWINLAYQMSFGVPAHVTWTTVLFNLKEAYHQSVYQTTILVAALVAWAAIMNL